MPLQNKTTETIIDIFWERVKTCADRPAVFQKLRGAYKPVLWREHGQLTEQVAAGLLKLGVAPQEKVAIMSSTCARWVWSDLGILNVGAVTVPIYPTLSKSEVEYLLKHSDAVGLFVENTVQLTKILDLETIPELLKFIVLLSGVAPSSRENLKIISFETLLKEGKSYLLAHGDDLSARRNEITPDTIATIVYTSGTTGVPKGAIITHSNIYCVCRCMSNAIGFHADDLMLSFLPLSHIFERIGGEFLAIYEGLMIAYAESIDTIAQNLLEVRPTVMGAVPRVFEKIHNRIITEVRAMPKALRYAVRWALSLSKQAQELRGQPANVFTQAFYSVQLKIADRFVFSRIRNRFGGRLRFIASGAAPLPIDIQSFFDTIGIPIIEGYGLTETTAPLCANVPNNIKPGTVGRPLPGVEVKVADDGEVLAKGPSIFSGYYKNESATQEVFKDGWFHTGDIGEFDADGFLTIKGRKKDIIVTSGGKKVAPQFLENMFAGEPLISHVLVYGEQHNYITALITLNDEGLQAFAEKHGILYANIEELVNDPLVIKYVQRVVHRKNRRLASFEQIKKFLILDKDFSVEAGELTPTLKIKRALVTSKYQNLLDSLYTEQGQSGETLEAATA
jgi:long-chain acyl-CoA synthetase